MEFKSTTSQFSLSRIIKEPTHIVSKSISCIDLVVTSQPNLVSDYSVHCIRIVTTSLSLLNLTLQFFYPLP